MSAAGVEPAGPGGLFPALYPCARVVRDLSLLQGWAFYSAFDLNGRGLKYMVTFRQYEPSASTDVVFDYSSGSIQISGCIPREP